MMVCYVQNCPPAGYNSSKEKEKLQKVMAYGSDLEPPAPAGPRPQEEEREESDRFDEREYNLPRGY